MKPTSQKSFAERTFVATPITAFLSGCMFGIWTYGSPGLARFIGIKNAGNLVALGLIVLVLPTFLVFVRGRHQISKPWEPPNKEVKVRFFSAALGLMTSIFVAEVISGMFFK